MNKHLSIIHLERRTDRIENLIKELDEQGITDYTIMEGVIDRAAVFRGICNAHKSVIRLAQQQRMENCIVAEDDICFVAPNAYNHFLQFLEDNPDYDLAFGMIYEGKINEENRIVKDAKSFSGLTLYSCNSRFYSTFLGMKDMNHLDRQLGLASDKYKYIVCPEFVAKQLNGYSDQKKKDCQYDKLLIGRKMFGS